MSLGALRRWEAGRLGGCIETTMEYILAWTDEWTMEVGSITQPPDDQNVMIYNADRWRSRRLHKPKKWLGAITNLCMSRTCCDVGTIQT